MERSSRTPSPTESTSPSEPSCALLSQSFLDDADPRPPSQAFYLVIVQTTFFSDTFGVVNIISADDDGLRMIIYLQVAQISQALVSLPSLASSPRPRLTPLFLLPDLHHPRPQLVLCRAPLCCALHRVPHRPAHLFDHRRVRRLGLHRRRGCLWRLHRNHLDLVRSLSFLHFGPALTLAPQEHHLVLPPRPHQVWHALAHRQVQRSPRCAHCRPHQADRGRPAFAHPVSRRVDQPVALLEPFLLHQARSALCWIRWQEVRLPFLPFRRGPATNGFRLCRVVISPAELTRFSSRQAASTGTQLARSSSRPQCTFSFPKCFLAFPH